ncbi:MAG TPA: hypothetical protein DCZ75_16820 [Geobacter sp.]|nr:hypothetical protein [Geobacter sp.]
MLYSNQTIDGEKSKNKYADKSIVAFVDILGFSSMIQSDPKGIKYIPIIERAIANALTMANITRQIDVGLDYRIFSDNICFWFPLKFHPLALACMLSVLAEFQLGLLLENLFCRGGVAIGYHYASEHTIYGPALVEAVSLEKTAKHPCIAIANEIIEDANLITLSLQTHQYHKIDFDGPWFVNYLGKIFFIQKEASLRILEEHRMIIKSKIVEFADTNNVLLKYKWIANYHNDLIGMISFKDECTFI